MEENFTELQPELIPTETIIERVKRKIREGYTFDFDNFFKDAWRIAKQMWWILPVSGFIIGIPIAIAYLIVSPFFVDTEVAARMQIRPGANFLEILEAVNQAQQSRPIGKTILQAVFQYIMILVSAPLQAGWIQVARSADKDDVSFADAFQFYKHPATGKIIGAGMITGAVNLISAIIAAAFPIAGSMANIIIGGSCYLLFLHVVPLIIFGNASIGEAFSLSIKLFFNKPFAIIGLVLLFFIIAMAGFIACCIGVLFTMCFIQICNYLVYKYSVGFPEDDREQEAEQHWQDVPPETL